MLTPTHLAAIDHHLRKDNWLLNEELIAELTDHYANAVEERMTAGQTFEQALQEIHAGFGGRPGLLGMEEQYQIEKNKEFDRVVWRQIRRYTGGEYSFISIGLFGLLYALNSLAESESVVKELFWIPKLFLMVNVLSQFAINLLRLYRGSKEADASLTKQTSGFFVLSYLGAFGLLLLDQYALRKAGYGLDRSVYLLLAALTQTLCLISYIGTGQAIRHVLRRKAVKPQR